MTLRVLTIAGLLLINGASSPAQVAPARASGVSYAFELIERGIASGNAEGVESLFGSTVSLRLLKDDLGVVSGNHAKIILGQFFRAHRPTSFVFSRVQRQHSRPYATGRLVWTSRGIHASAQVYVSLQHAGNRWLISQLNIY